MLYLLFDHMNQCTDAEVQRMLPLVSEQRREQALRYKFTSGRFCCLKSYLMLMELLGAVCPELDGKTPLFEYNDCGKPAIAGRPDLHFSISHTKNAILVALSMRPIGADIEQIRSASEALIRKTMNEEEQAFIADANLDVDDDAIADNEDNTPVVVNDNEESNTEKTDDNEESNTEQSASSATVFTALWTQKEAVLKLRGTGIQDDLYHVLDGPEIVTTEIRKTYCFSFAEY